MLQIKIIFKTKIKIFHFIVKIYLIIKIKMKKIHIIKINIKVEL